MGRGVMMKRRPGLRDTHRGIIDENPRATTCLSSFGEINVEQFLHTNPAQLLLGPQLQPGGWGRSHHLLAGLITPPALTAACRLVRRRRHRLHLMRYGMDSHNGRKSGPGLTRRVPAATCGIASSASRCLCVGIIGLVVEIGGSIN